MPPTKTQVTQFDATFKNGEFFHNIFQVLTTFIDIVGKAKHTARVSVKFCSMSLRNGNWSGWHQSEDDGLWDFCGFFQNCAKKIFVIFHCCCTALQLHKCLWWNWICMQNKHFQITKREKQCRLKKMLQKKFRKTKTVKTKNKPFVWNWKLYCQLQSTLKSLILCVG